jgi:hypothetical protein
MCCVRENKDQYLELVKITLHHDSLCMFLMEGVRDGGGAHTCHQHTSHASEVKRVMCIMTIKKGDKYLYFSLCFELTQYT